MSLISYTLGQGSIVLRVKVLNSSVSTGAGLTGLTSASAGLIISTIADNEATATAYTVTGSTIESITTLGTYAAPTATKCRFKEVDATNHPGVYEIQIADARYAVASAKSLLVTLSGATNASETDALVPLTQTDPYDNVRGGITALPNAAADAAGGLVISDAGGLDIDAMNTAAVRLTAARAQVLDDWINAGRLDAILDIIAADVANIDGAAMRGTDSAALAADLLDKLGAVNETAAAGDPSTTESVMQYVKQIVNVLVGTTGVTTMPASAAPANNVSLAEIIRSIYDDSDQLQTRYQNGGYADGAVWIDTVNGAAGTTDYVNGTQWNPVSTIANALTIAASIGLTRFRIVNNSVITLAASAMGKTFVGDSWTLGLGGQDITDAVFIGASVTGVGVATDISKFTDCRLGAVTFPSLTIAHRCAIEGTQTLGTTGSYHYEHCRSGIAGSAAPIFDFGALNVDQNLNIRGYSGGIDVRNMGQSGTDNLSVEGDGQLILNANCVGGTLVYRGNWDFNDSSTGVTITTDDKSRDVPLILVDTSEIGTAGAGLTDLGGMSTTMKDQVNTQVDGALDTAIPAGPTANSINERIASMDDGIVNGTVDTVTNTHTPTTTVFQADDITEATTDHFVGRIVTFLTGALANQSTDITAYSAVGGIGQFTVTAMTEAPSNNDTFKIT